MKSWALYLAGKYMMPIAWMSDTNLFFKLGVMYRTVAIPANALVWTAGTIGTKTRKSNFVRPMFATGLDYAFDQNWSGVFQYAYFMGANNSFAVARANNNVNAAQALGTVGANVFTLGLAYNFNV